MVEAIDYYQRHAENQQDWQDHPNEFQTSGLSVAFQLESILRSRDVLDLKGHCRSIFRRSVSNKSHLYRCTLCHYCFRLIRWRFSRLICAWMLGCKRLKQVRLRSWKPTFSSLDEVT